MIVQPKTWKRICRLVLACMAVLAIFSLPPVYWRVVGWVKGEAFYQGRPTSYWAGRIQESWDAFDQQQAAPKSLTLPKLLKVLPVSASATPALPLELKMAIPLRFRSCVSCHDTPMRG